MPTIDIAWIKNNYVLPMLPDRPSFARLGRTLFLCAALLPLSGMGASEILLRHATIHPVTGQVLTNGDVLIRDGKIAALGQSLTAETATAVDLTGLHLYPGLISASTLLGLLEIEAVRATVDAAEVGAFAPDVESWIAVNPDSELIPVARANGITHVLPVPLGHVVAGQSGLMALTGWTSEEMVVKKPAALHVFWPNLSLDTRPKPELKQKEKEEDSKWKSLADQAQERRRQLEELDRFFAEAKAYAVASTNQPADRPAPVPAWDAMLPFMRQEVPLMIHANDLRQIKSAVAWAVSNQFRMILAGGRDAWMVPSLLASNNIPVIFEQIFLQPAQDTLPYDVYFRAPALLREAGVKVILSEGLDPSAASTLRNLPYAAAQAVAYGLNADEALKSITLYPAEILGLSQRLGSVEVGKEASLFAATGDILDIRAQVKYLWISGQPINLESRHTRLYDKYRHRPPPK